MVHFRSRSGQSDFYYTCLIHNLPLQFTIMGNTEFSAYVFIGVETGRLIRSSRPGFVSLPTQYERIPPQLILDYTDLVGRFLNARPSPLFARAMVHFSDQQVPPSANIAEEIEIEDDD